MFIAIMSDERQAGKLHALPNLEARIVCANTLATIADHKWRPDRTGQLVDSDSGIQQALAHVADVQAEWLEAHSETQKDNVRARDLLARDQLTAKLEEANWDRDLHPEIWNFAEHKIFDTNAGISQADARLIFYRQGLEGFDIVIESMPVSDTWLEDSKINSKAINIGKQFEKLLEYSGNITKSISGTKGKTVYNINFHEVTPQLIEQADKLYLKALNIGEAEIDLTIDELYKLRSNSNWR